MRLFIYAIIFFSFFDLFTQLPVMSTFAGSVGATPFIAGLAVGMYSFSNTFGNILSGFWTDKKGPFYVLVFGLFLTGGSLFLYRLVEEPLLLLTIRFVHGLVAGLIVPAAFTYLANATDQTKRGKSGAISGAFVGIAAITGPAFSGIMSTRISVPFVFTVTAIFMLVLAGLALIVLRNTQVTKKSKQPLQAKTVHVRDFFRHSGTLKAFAGAFFLMFSQGVIAYQLPLHVQSLGFDARMSGMLMSVFGIVAVLVFILPTNRIFDKVAPTYTLASGIGLMGISQLLLSQAHDSTMLYTALSCYGVGFGLLFPSINSLLIDSTPAEVRGKAYGYFYAFFSFGVVIGSSLLGLLGLPLSQGFIVTGVILLLFASVNLIQFSKEKQTAH